ncbi:MAG: hypothetical protein H6626_12845 [Pseudobdellovibrionaceae bacterium]|nr:MAG: hypothetical protein H6626_12845 [Pseudobdellovibrionaceae bacterium]
MKRIKKMIVISFLMLTPFSARADMWGGDIPLLIEIVTNTLNTLMELRDQSRMMEDEMAGIKDRINRIRTISNVVQPSNWHNWKDPKRALEQLRIIYYTMPKEYRSKKSDAIEHEISKAMNMISRISGEAQTTFRSGKELERRGADASPGVAQKLTASGVGTLVAMEAQTQVIQSHITSLLTQMLADGNERESRLVASKGKSFASVSPNLGDSDSRFSAHVLPLRMSK